MYVQPNANELAPKIDEVTGDIHLESEFANVRVCLDEQANGPRLAVVDLRSGLTAFLDPLELEAFVYCRHEDLSSLLDPGSGRWTGPD